MALEKAIVATNVGAIPDMLDGCGIVIEKGFQEGGALLRQKGYKIESLAIVDSMSVESGVEFRKDN